MLTSSKDILSPILTLANGTLFSQGILILSAPVLTRLYTPQQFGEFILFISLLSILLILVSLRYEMAIPLAKQDETAVHLLYLALLLVGLNSLAGFLIGFILFPALRLFIDSIDFPYGLIFQSGLIFITDSLYWLTFAIMGAGTYQVLKYFCQRHRHFSLISHTQIKQSLTQVTVQIGWGLTQLGSWGLLLGYILAQWLGLIILGRQIPLRTLQPTQLKAVAITYRAFPLYTLWASLFNVLGWQLPPLFFAAFFSTEIAGWYGLTLRVLGMPSALLGQAVAQVFYPLAAHSPHPANLIERIATLLLVTGSPLFILIFLQGELLFTLAFGNAWSMAGRYAEWLAPWFMLAFISSPLSTFSLVKAQQRQALWFSLYETSLRLIAISIGIYWVSVPLAIQLFSAAGVFICWIYIVWVFKLADSHWLTWFNSVKIYFLVAGNITFGLYLLSPWLPPIPALMLSGICLTLLGSWGWQIYRKLDFSESTNL